MLIHSSMIKSAKGKSKFENTYNEYRNLMYRTASKILMHPSDGTLVLNDQPKSPNCALHAFMLTTFVDMLIWVVFFYVLAAQLGFAAICWAYPVGWIAGTALSVIFFWAGVWKRDLI